jgi:hypothetical protein
VEEDIMRAATWMATFLAAAIAVACGSGGSSSGGSSSGGSSSGGSSSGGSSSGGSSSGGSSSGGDPCAGVSCGYHGTCDTSITPGVATCTGCDWVPQSGSAGSCMHYQGDCTDFGPNVTLASIQALCGNGPYSAETGVGWSTKSCKDTVVGRTPLGYCDLPGTTVNGGALVCSPPYNSTVTEFACPDGGVGSCYADPKSVCDSFRGIWRTG